MSENRSANISPRRMERYEVGNVLRYTAGSRVLGFKAGEYARVEQVHAHDNTLTVVRDTGDRVTYDPRRLQGITAYREEDRALSVGDRVQFTTPDRTQRVANRDLGTIEAIDRAGQMRVRLDAGRSVTVSDRGRAHLDYGYAVTSHSSQGQTADRVLVHVETARGGEQLVNQRFAYVAVSRGRHDAQIYTDNKAHLPHVLGRDVSHASAMSPSQEIELHPSR